MEVQVLQEQEPTSTSWCGYCKKARNYFRAKGITFTEYSIEKSRRAKRDYDAIGGNGVPVILAGPSRMNGFNEQGFERLRAKLSSSN